MKKLIVMIMLVCLMGCDSGRADGLSNGISNSGFGIDAGFPSTSPMERINQVEEQLKESQKELDELRAEIEMSETRWVPEYGEKYYTIASSSRSLLVVEWSWDNDNTDRTKLRQNLVFKTEEDAEECLERILRITKSFAEANYSK